MNEFLVFVVSGLAVYRVARMLAMEDGPADSFLRWRLYVTEKTADTKWEWVAKGFNCVFCISFWAACVTTFWLVGFGYIGWAIVPLMWAALSGVAVILHRILG